METQAHAWLFVFIYDITNRHTAVCTAGLCTVCHRKDTVKEDVCALAYCLRTDTEESNARAHARGHLVPDMAKPLREQVIKLYKTLLYLGREYPQGSAYFRERLKAAFMKNKDVTDPEKIKQLVARGDFVIKELEALYFLRKYRAMKKRYYDPEN